MSDIFPSLAQPDCREHPDTVTLPSQPSELAPATGSPVECDTCHHWEWDDGKHGFASGYCPIFDKITYKEDGSKCTAWEKIHLENAKLRDGEAVR